MAMLIQKSAGLLSSLISGNEFYEVCCENRVFPCNSGGFDTGYKLIDTDPIIINFTPTKITQFKGAILEFLVVTDYSSTAYQRTITVKLQRYIGATWTDRETVVIDTDDYIPDGNYPRFHGLIDCRVPSPTTNLNTNPDEWRVTVAHDGTGYGTFYLKCSHDGPSDDSCFMIPYVENTVTFTSSDTLVLTDKITLDQNWTIPSKDAQYGTHTGLDYRSRYYSIWGCAPEIGVTTPQIYVPSTVAGDYTLELQGGFFISSHQKALLAGEDSGNPIPSSRTFDIYFSNNASGDQHGFITHSPLVTTPARLGKLGCIELWGDTPAALDANLASDALSGQANIIVEGDLTSVWSIGDFIEIGGAQFTAARQYYDSYRNEYREIQNISYSAGPDETTITVTSNLSYNHYYHSEVPVKITYAERNVRWRGNDTTYNLESYSTFNAGHFKIQGVRLEQIYTNELSRNYAVTYSASELLAEKYEIDGCNFHDCAYPLYFFIIQTAIEIRNCTISSALTGTTVYFTILIYLYQCVGSVVEDNVFAGRVINGVMMVGGYEHTIDGNYFNIFRCIRYSGSVREVTISNNTFFRCRTANYLLAANNITWDTNIYRKCLFDSNYSADTEIEHGAYYFVSGYSNLDNMSLDEDADDCFAYIVMASEVLSTHTFKDCVFGSTFTDDVVSESGPTYRPGWIEGTRLGFENYDGLSGHCINFLANGYIESTGNGLPDTTSKTAGTGLKAWRFLRYATDRILQLQFEIPIGVLEPISISIFCKLNSTNYAAGTYDPPKIQITGLGVTGNGTIAEANVTLTDWQLLTVGATPTETGQLTVTLSIKTDAVGSDGYVYWDDMYISYKTPLDLGGLDLVSDALPIFPPITIVLTAASVWSELLADNDNPGSMGERMNEIINEIWDEPIAGHLTDGTTGKNLSDASAASSPTVVADAVWDEPIGDHQSAGSAGRSMNTISAETTVQATPSPTQLSFGTSLTEADDFYNGLIVVVINSSGVIARKIADYEQTNGVITVDVGLPFTPSSGDDVIILRRYAPPVEPEVIASGTLY